MHTLYFVEESSQTNKSSKDDRQEEKTIDHTGKFFLSDSQPVLSPYSTWMVIMHSRIKCYLFYVILEPGGFDMLKTLPLECMNLISLVHTSVGFLYLYFRCSMH